VPARECLRQTAPAPHERGDETITL